MGIKEEITKIAVEHGYDGAKPKSIAQAIDALADTLAGEDVTGSRSIDGAIHALAPYIGSGGGTERVELFNETVTTEDANGMNRGVVHGNGTTADEVHVTFDGTEYELPRVQFPGGDNYGYGAFGETGPDFSTYPLMLSYSPEVSSWNVFTETAGTYTIVAYTVSDGSGGGEGITLGPLQGSVINTISTPVVGEEVGTSLKCSGLKVGSQAVLGFYSESDGVSDCRVAAGVTYESMYLTAYSAEDVHDFHTYIATLDNDWKYATIEPADVVLSVVYDPDINMSRLSFVMPELDANEVLIIQQPAD